MADTQITYKAPLNRVVLVLHRVALFDNYHCLRWCGTFFTCREGCRCQEVHRFHNYKVLLDSQKGKEVNVSYYCMLIVYVIDVINTSN